MSPAPTRTLDAARYLMALRDAQDGFHGFVSLLHPDWRIPHFQLDIINALDALEKGSLGVRNLLLTLPPRHAKALDIDTPIPLAPPDAPTATPAATPAATLNLTPDTHPQPAFKRLGDLQPGDRIWHPSGRPTTVTAVSPIFLGRPCYAVRTSDEHEVVCDADHLWTARVAPPSQTRRRQTDPRSTPYRTLTTAELIPTLDDGRPRLPSQRPTQSADQTSIPNSPSPYTREGLHAYGARLARMAGEFTVIERQQTVTPGTNTFLGDLAQQSASRPLTPWFTIEEHLFLLPPRDREALLEGIASAARITGLAAAHDPAAQFRREHPYICQNPRNALLFTLSPALALDIRRLAASLNRYCVLRTLPGPLDATIHVLILRAEEVHDPKTSRYPQGRHIEDIRPVVSRPVRCITVDAEDGLFLAGDGFVPTHNSTYATVLFPVWFMARDPRRQVMSCSYNSDLATGFGREIRDLLGRREIGQAFPDFRLSTESRAADAWRTEAGGTYFALGLGGTTSGRAANCLILDDLFKARADAQSPTMRNRVWSYYTSALVTRLQPDHTNRPPLQIICNTRWHPDDLIGRLMETREWQEGRWLHLDFPALTFHTETVRVPRTELPKDHPLHLDPDNPEHAELIAHAERTRPHPDTRPHPAHELVETERTIATALWPERFSVEELERRRRLNPMDFEALYQQRPYIEGGNLIRADWWRSYSADLQPTNFQQLIIVADTAMKRKQSADYSVAMVLGLDATGDIYILDVQRARLDYPDLRRLLIRMNERWRPHGLRALYVEDRSSGTSIISDLQRAAGVAVIAYPVTRDKVERVQAVLPLIQGGRVFLPEAAPWLEEFLVETTSFPASRNDDQVDALSMGLDILSRSAVTRDLMEGHVNLQSSLNAEMARAAQSHHAPGHAPSRAPGHTPGRFPPASPPSALPLTSTQAQSPFGKSLARALKASGWSGWGN